MQVAFSFQQTAPHLMPSFGRCSPTAGAAPTPINTKLSSPNGYRTRRTTSPYLQSRITKDGVIKKKYVYPKKMCTIPGCNTPRKSKGLCKKHGGAKQCDIHGCNKNAKSGGKCIHHGGGLCMVEGCKSGARKNRMCYIHNQERLQQGLRGLIKEEEEADSQASPCSNDSEESCSTSFSAGEEEEVIATFDFEAFEPLPWSPSTTSAEVPIVSPYLISADELHALLQGLPDGDALFSSVGSKVKIEPSYTPMATTGSYIKPEPLSLKAELLESSEDVFLSTVPPKKEEALSLAEATAPHTCGGVALQQNLASFVASC